MADISWSAYALAMFTPEQRAAAVQGVEYRLPPDEPIAKPPLPPAVPSAPIPVWPDGLNPNLPGNQDKLFAMGWRFEGGKWFKIAPGSLGTAVRPTDDPPGGRGPGLSSVVSAAVVVGGSVLGYAVPAAPPVLLPQWVGGRLGMVVRSGGTRPESGGVMLVKRGTDVPWARVRRG